MLSNHQITVSSLLSAHVFATAAGTSMTLAHRDSKSQLVRRQCAVPTCCSFGQVWDRRPLYCTAVPGEAPWVAALNPGEQDTSALRPPTPPHREAGERGCPPAPTSHSVLCVVMKQDLQHCMGAFTFKAGQRADALFGSSATAPLKSLGSSRSTTHTHSERTYDSEGLLCALLEHMTSITFMCSLSAA